MGEGGFGSDTGGCTGQTGAGGMCWDLRFKYEEPVGSREPSHVWHYRIVVAGTLLQNAIVPNSAGPFDFQAAYGLSDQTVCDYPLDRLYSNGGLGRRDGVRSRLLAITVFVDLKEPLVCAPGNLFPGRYEQRTMPGAKSWP